MSGKLKMSLRSLVNLFPIMFAMIMLAAILFPVVLVTLTLMQTGVPIEPLLVAAALFWLILAGTAVPGVLREPLSTPSRRLWILAICALPLVGVFAWFIKKYRDLP